MPREELTEQEIEAFRERAVRAATRLFARKGYEAVTMRALASELGVSAMTPYRYFQDKEALFARVRTDAFRRFADRQAAAIQSSDQLKEKLTELGRAYFRFAMDEPEAYRIMFELHQKTTRFYPGLKAQQKRAFSYLHQALNQAVEARQFEGDPLTVAHLAWAQMHGIVSLHLAGKLIMGRSVEELIDAALPHRGESPNRQGKDS